MQGVPDYFDCPSDRAEFRAVAGRAGVELYRAHIVHHTFEPHTHDAYGFGVIEQGVERFRYKGSDHLAPSDSIVFMHPDVLHTGRAETDGGWRYRMIYIDPTVLADIAGDAGWWFDETVVERDRPRAKHLTRLLKALWQVQDPLVFDGLLSQLVEGLSPYARRQSSAQHQSERRFANVIDYMQAHLGERIVLEDLASVAGLSPFSFPAPVSGTVPRHAAPDVDGAAFVCRQTVAGPGCGTGPGRGAGWAHRPVPSDASVYPALRCDAWALPSSGYALTVGQRQFRTHSNLVQDALAFSRDTANYPMRR